MQAVRQQVEALESKWTAELLGIRELVEQT